MKDKHLHIRVSSDTLLEIKEKANACGISQSKLVLIATKLVKEDDVFQYLLDNKK